MQGGIFINKNSYTRVKHWFVQHKTAQRILRLFYFLFPAVIFAAYAGLLLYLLFRQGYTSVSFLKTLLIPAGVFLAVSLFRKWYNAPRPYEVYETAPFISKNKKGQSFPSRHCASAFIIAMAFLYTCLPAGVCFLILGTVIAAARVLGGVHFIKDVLAGAGFSILCGWLFFFLI